MYRSRPRFLRRDGGDGDRGLDGLRRDAPGLPREPRPQRVRRRPRVGAVVRFALLALVAWVLVSTLLFMVSAQIQRQGIADEAAGTLSPAGFTLTSPNTVLILGSDRRTPETAEPGSSTTGPSRADSIMLMRVGGGANATLSIPRDTVVDIPGVGRSKINASYAIGGPALAVTTVEQYLGIEVNHLVEVNFENFPALVDALGGVTVRTGCVVSRINGGDRNGGYTLRLRRGRHELDGEQALALARTRKNDCAPSEDDRTRARRQQQILAGIKDKVTSFETFARLPWVSWAAPKAVRSDMAGPALLGVAGASVAAGKASTRVLRPFRGVMLPDGGAGLEVSEDERRRAVRRFLAG